MDEIAARRGHAFGAQESWDKVVLENQDYIYKIACHLTGNVHEAEDVTQETFLKAFEHRDDFRGEASIRTWLYRIAVNTYLARQRKRNRSGKLEADAADSRAWFESPEHMFIKGEFLQCIHYLLEHECRKSDRLVLVMREIEGMSYSEMAEILGITVSAAKVRLHRARKSFRDILIRCQCAAVVSGGRCVCEGVHLL